MIEKIINGYEKVFGAFKGNIYFAPGRINLIGEHTDYNGGHVFPCALSMGTYLAVEKRNDSILRFYSENFPESGVIEVYLKHLINEKKDDWANYPKGIIKLMQEGNYEINRGLNLYYYGNIPNGAGLSSSASIEMVTGVMLNDLFNLHIDIIEVIKLAQRSENQFIGVNCGIMDQFAIGMGKKNNAILLDTNKLTYEYAPLYLKNYSLIITNTNKRRGLADSKYNERRSECDKALSILKQYADISALGDLTIDLFNELSGHIADDTMRKRAKHAVYENIRTIEAKKALDDGNLDYFGKLMNESHISLRDDYEVTGKELDTLVSLAWKTQGVLGSRMTGAGFGGCTISIVENDYVEDFQKNIETEYEKYIGYKPTFYVVEIGDGARKLY